MGNFDRRGKSSDRGGRGGFGGRSERPTMHKAVCDSCKKDCEVPFRPSGDKPIYCSDCFGKEGKGSRVDNNSERLDNIEKKLDEILKALGSKESVAKKKVLKVVKEKKVVKKVVKKKESKKPVKKVVKKKAVKKVAKKKVAAKKKK